MTLLECYLSIQYTYYICKHIQLSYTICASNNSTAVHILGHEGKSTVFLEKNKIRPKRGKKKDRKRAKTHKNIPKIGKCFTIFEDDTLIHLTIACIIV